MDGFLTDNLDRTDLAAALGEIRSKEDDLRCGSWSANRTAVCSSEAIDT